MFYTIDRSQPYYYSPVPLSTSIQNYPAVSINNYVSGQPYPASTTIQNFSSVDLDSWGLLALQAVDQLLSPEFAVPAFLIDSGQTLQKILDSKQILAEAIIGTMTTIIDPGPLPAPKISQISAMLRKCSGSIFYRVVECLSYQLRRPKCCNRQIGIPGDNDDPPAKPYVPRLMETCPYGRSAGE